ncbi:hypothetical protein GCM10027277_33200 [Pseudoduganella ginsengisoli]|uniref:Uncharacterized protein n=1 Tax=Pseudoduganella ginsengisoli TaxID=1462440 RepID=A0A6L6Q715_9BURK|nr:hypothetical protein [Pseudoduganella ginsengisoli]MTW05306.1 hypothetical protein [Pseudoduganella ginsengisoli]
MSQEPFSDHQVDIDEEQKEATTDLTWIEKATVIGELLLTELGGGPIFFLQIIVTLLLWALFRGTDELIRSLPPWALAAAGGGVSCMLPAALLLRLPQFFFAPVGLTMLLAIDVACSGYVIGESARTAAHGPMGFLSFSELVEGFAWLVASMLALGGLLSCGMVAAHYKELRRSR